MLALKPSQSANVCYMTFVPILVMGSRYANELNEIFEGIHPTRPTAH